MREDFDQLIKDLIDKNAFIKRRLSWVAQDDRFFYKIPRKSSSLSLDIKDNKINNQAEQEFKNLKLLNNLASNLVEAPVYFSQKYSCTINQKIKGEDLRDILLNLKQEELIETELKKVISKIVRLHQVKPEAEINQRDYSKIESLTPESLERINMNSKVVNSSGVSVRNFKYNERGKLLFFDPTRVYLGIPEDDLARFIFSLLIIKWGRNFKLSIFKKFDLIKLLKYYEEQTGAKLDWEVFFVMFDLNMKAQDKSTKKKMGRFNIFAIPMFFYSRIFFYQINKWRSKNYVKLSQRN